MPTFELTFANRFELLLEQFLACFDDLPADPFEPVRVIVPGAAVRRRLELAIANRHGVCANVDFVFLAGWVWQVIGQVVPVAERSPFEAQRLQWRLFDLLAEPALPAAHPRLARYLRDADPVMRLSLAQRVAGQFEQLITYRPDWLAAWLDGRRAVPHEGGDTSAEADEAWQADLWRRVSLAVGAGRQHPSVAFFEALARGVDVPLPRRLLVFGLPALPPLYLDLLRGLSAYTDIHYFALNPCREYWFEIVAPRRLGYLRRAGRDALHEVGHPLLAAWGRQTQGHIDTLLGDDGVIAETGSRFESAGRPTLLAQVQNAILDLVDPPDRSVSPAPDDRSIELHVCHSLMRELQVLHDQLLAMFATIPDLQPSDIAVLLPDLADAAPLVDAVFGAAPAVRRVPFTLSGLPRRQANEQVRALDCLLRLLPGRLPASAVFEFIEQAPVARRFGWSADDLERLRDWLDRAGIRWGLSDAQRVEAGLPAGGRASFDDGLRRLHLAYAAGEETDAFGGWIGAADPHGQSALLLGRLTAFVDTLAGLRDDWRTPADADRWRTRLLDACDRLFAVDVASAETARELRAGIGRWHQDAREAGLAARLDLPVVRESLMAVLDEPARGAVPGGAVTFAAIGGLRSLPYRVVCLLGMNDRAFPRLTPPLEFDLIARFPRRGDRQRRDDERTLFLDCLLAARDRFYVSYTGRHARDNTPLPPSVLVSELFDHLSRIVGEPVAGLKVDHPLAAFSVDAFADDPQRPGDLRRRSFNEAYGHALARRERLRSRLAAQGDAAAAETELNAAEDLPDDWVRLVADDAGVYFPRALPAPPPELRQVSLDDLVRFFRNPCAALLRRVGVVLPRPLPELADDEPFAADWDGLRRLSARLLPHVLDGLQPDRLVALARAGTEMPPGELGRRLVENTLDRLGRLAARVAPLLAEPVMPPLTVSVPVALDGEHWELGTVFSDLRAAGLVRFRDGAPQVEDRLELWIAHLLLCASGAPGVERRTRWFGADGAAFEYAACAAARAELARLLALYRAGLVAPLHFFPRSAWAYVDEGRKLSAAQFAWVGSEFGRRGEREHPAYRLALRGVADPLDAAFVAGAGTVFDPLVAHRTES